MIARSRNQLKWYRSDGHEHVYISKRDRALAEQLAVKKYLTQKAKELTQELKALDFYLRHHHEQDSTAESMLQDTSGYAELLVSYFKPLSDELYEWMNSPYEHNEKYADQLIHKTTSGIYVRSKSEAIIAMFLHINRIPFRYEAALQLGDITFYPDFTIRHPKTGETYYWEHFGLMDDLSYSRNAASKIAHFSEHGIYPSIGLITTYETLEHPLATDLVEKVVKYYFLE